MARDCVYRGRRRQFPHLAGISSLGQRLSRVDSIPHCGDGTVRFQIAPRDQFRDAQRLAIAIQTYRVAGIMFVFLFLTDGILPAGFGWPAGIGDAITGIFAPVVALMVARNRPNAFKWAVAWNLFGTLDLIVAPATALYFEARVLSIYPLNLVPLFLGPPIGILTHIYSLRNLAVNTTA